MAGPAPPGDGPAPTPNAPIRIDDGYPAWSIFWRSGYIVARRWGALMRALVWMGVPSFRNQIVELALTGRRTGKPRPVLLTLIRLDGSWYVGHPNGSTGWIANLAAAAAPVAATILGQPPVRVRSTALPLGLERTAVIRETSRQQLIPVRPFYWAARGHILRAGVYLRLELVER